MPGTLSTALAFAVGVALCATPARASVVHDGLVSWWTMDEPAWTGAAHEVRDSQGENHCTAIGDSSNARGYLGGSGVFDNNVGAVDFVSCGAGIQVTGAYTFEAWVLVERGQAFRFWQRGSGGSASGNAHIELFLPPGDSPRPHVVHRQANHTSVRTFASGAIPTGLWAHVALTWEKLDWKLYVNGRAVDVHATVGAPANPAIGGDTELGLAPPDGPAAGKLDEVRIYQRALTAEEVANNFGHDRGLVSWWRMEETSWSGVDDEVADSQGVSPCTAVGEPTTERNGYIGRGGVFGQTSGALDYLSCGTGNQVSSAYTFEAWAYLEPGERFGFWRRGAAFSAALDSQIELYVPDGPHRRPHVVHNRARDKSWRAFADHSIPAGRWVHVVLTWAALDWRLYVNGVEVGVQATVGTRANPPTGRPTYLGLGGRESAATGKLDEVRIYDRALSRQEVWARYEVSDVARRPHVERVRRNLLPDPSFESPGPTPNRWFYGKGAERSDEPKKQRTGQWSVRLPPPNAGSNVLVRSPLTPVTPGRVYTAAFHLRTAAWPPPIIKPSVIEYRIDQSGRCKERFGNQIFKGNQAPAAQDAWNEVTTFHAPSEGVCGIRIKVQRADDMVGHEAADLWLDDFYLGEDLSFERPPTEKQSFTGSRVRFDELGNIELRQGTTWAPFIPRVIYPNKGSEDDAFDWAKYSHQGFNVVNHPRSAARVAKAKAAGLLVSFSLDNFLNPSNMGFGNTRLLEESIVALKEEGLLDQVILYSWDNEAGFQHWDNVRATVSQVRGLDGGAPIYALNIHPGLARLYNSGAETRMQDLTGGYVGDSAFGVGSPHDHNSWQLFLQDRLERQSSPAFMIQLNRLEGDWNAMRKAWVPRLNPAGALRARVYRGLILGARAFTIYADCRPNLREHCYREPKVEDTRWWGELAKISEEVEQLIPLLRTPHWTKWTLTVDASPNTVIWGTRYLHGRGYLLLANMEVNPRSPPATITLSGADPGYAPRALLNYFDGAEVATMTSEGAFVVTLPPAGTAVYQLAAD